LEVVGKTIVIDAANAVLIVVKRNEDVLVADFPQDLFAIL